MPQVSSDVIGYERFPIHHDGSEPAALAGRARTDLAHDGRAG
ncbi:MAG: hypothetical protein RIB61_06125 [Roseicyclus sp.]